MFELLTAPQVDAETLEELKAILLAQRADAKKDFRTVIQALRQYNRYGTNSLYLRALTDVQLQALTVTELQGLVRGLTQYHRSVDYSGTVPEADVRAVITRVPESSTPRVAPPPYRQFAITAPQRDRVLVFDQAQAQAQVYIEYGDGLFDESATPLVNLFNDYFWGSMSGIVFQELREARALAYDAAGIYSAGARRNEQNLVIGYIGSQADKTTEALSAFLGLFNDMPASGDRFEATRESILSRYRTGKLTFREIAGAVRGWERLEVPIDPRPARFARLQETDLDDVVTFHREHARGRPRLISVLGDVARFDLESLRATADVEVMELNQLFSY
jgi:predicted Zn-dependent peptidase